MERFSLLGVRFSCGTREELLADAADRIKKARKARGIGTAEEAARGEKAVRNRGRGGEYIVTPNAEITYRAARDADFCGILNRAATVLPDGVGVTAAARLFGVRLCRFPGIEFAEHLLAAAPPEGYRLFLLGGRAGVAERAAATLEERFLRVRVVGVHHGYFKDAEDAAVTAAITAAEPDLLFVCLGSPRQEKWMAVHPLPCLALGLGGALDVWSGRVRRAPRLLRRMGLEWLFRLLSEPKRWRRAPALFLFMGAVLRKRLSFFSQTARKRRFAPSKNRQM